MFICDCGVKFELTEQQLNYQKLVMRLSRFYCSDCIEKIKKMRRQSALVLEQRRQKQLRRRVRMVIHNAGGRR